MNLSAKVFSTCLFVIVCCVLASAQGNCRSTNNFVGGTGKGSKATSPADRTCTCDSPCSGSISCTVGCYAFCEKNAGRNICVKGCSEASQASAAGETSTIARTTELSRFSLNMPASDAVSLMKKVFGVELADSGQGNRMLNLRLRNVSLKGVLKAFSARGVTQPSKQPNP
jgi:hypothetical protein